MRAIDCQGFAGGFTMGVVQAGFELAHKAEMSAGFGVANCTTNRHLLGDDWQVQSCDPSEWEPVPDVQFLFGNPPCSGFSALSSKSFRGIDSPINHCMWALVDYAARVDPLIVAFESVQPAYRMGLPLMRRLVEKLRADTRDETWNLYHVLHNNLALGGVAQRPRYFWLASRVPFGVEHPELERTFTLRDAVGDLEHLPLLPGPQAIDREPTEWSADRRHTVTRTSGDGILVVEDLVDGHVPHPNDAGSRRLWDLREHSEPWEQGESIQHWAKRYWERTGTLPTSWPEGSVEKYIAQEWDGFGWHRPKRWRYDRPAHVITGGSPTSAVHPTQYRYFTYREVARIMGFPDAWRIQPLIDSGSRTIKESWGKGISVHSGYWLASWVRASLGGSPGSIGGKVIGDREYEITVTKPRVRTAA